MTSSLRPPTDRIDQQVIPLKRSGEVSNPTDIELFRAVRMLSVRVMSERKQRTKDLERKLELKIEKEWQRLVAAQQELREKREELKILQIRVNNRNADVNQNSKALRQQRTKLALPFSAINTRRRFFGDNTLDLPDSLASLTKKKSPFGWIRRNYH
ncbi:glycosyltransferase-like protein gnt15 [Vespula squamosa]|uniref:Glycosyltransferase-like protein gnt15 n=1 Tax=Vespula squamosa TaxID=30214 RepID=A0ABD2BEU7_VESSQ